jgi:tetratricopeptide (TPR) repeat protein
VEELARVTQYLGQAQSQMADQSRSVSGFQQALETYQKALAIHTSAGPQASESWQRGLSIRYQYIGYALMSLGDCTGDVSYYQRALDAALKRNEISRSLASSHSGQPDAAITRALADDLCMIGLLRWKCCRDLSGALRDLRESRERFERLAAADPKNLEARRDVASAFARTGEVLADAARKAEALSASREALTIYEELARADSSSMENAGYIAQVRARIAGLQTRK